MGRSLPIIVRVFSGPLECLKEEFSYNSYVENELFNIEVLPNFWGDGKNVVMVVGTSTAYGSGSTRHLHFITYRNGAYYLIEGPRLNELSIYKFYDGTGRKIIVATGIWESGEAHFDPHRFGFASYDWTGENYTVTNLGTTKNKYASESITIDDLIELEPLVLSPL